MALWGVCKLFFCILFITCSWTTTRAEIPIDCCLSVSAKPIGKGRRIVDYQEQAEGCSITATILVTKGGKNLCVPLNEKWVQDIKDRVDKLKKQCKRSNYKGQRCSGVKREQTDN